MPPQSGKPHAAAACDTPMDSISPQAETEAKRRMVCGDMRVENVQTAFAEYENDVATQKAKPLARDGNQPQCRMAPYATAMCTQVDRPPAMPNRST